MAKKSIAKESNFVKVQASPEIIIFQDGEDFLTTSVDIANNFNKRHDHVIATIDELRNSLQKDVPYFRESDYINERGKNYKMYKITRDGFSLLVMGFTGKKALVWKLKYIEAFNKMEALVRTNLKRRVSESYQQARISGKKIRLEETDAIKLFVEYATNQGSTKAKMYYCNVTQMTNKALFYLVEGMAKPNNLREVLDTFQLFQVSVADRLVSDTMKGCMAKGMYYKDIYKECASKVNQLAATIGKTTIPQQQLTLVS